MYKSCILNIICKQKFSKSKILTIEIYNNMPTINFDILLTSKNCNKLNSNDGVFL